MSKNISYSAIKIWKECPFKYKLKYVDNIDKFHGNEYTAFGTALHETCEKKLLDNTVEEVEFFSNCFEEQVKKVGASTVLKEELLNEMREQGKLLAPLAIPALKQKFGNFTVLTTEEELLEIISQSDWKFKGYIDLVIKTEDGKVHILDWKSCAWGWDAEKRSDALTVYQLILYKSFYAQKYNMNLDDIEVHFALLKRTAKKDNVEIVDITSGPVRVKNAILLMNRALENINKKFFVKNRLSCTYCEYKKTKECP